MHFTYKTCALHDDCIVTRHRHADPSFRSEVVPIIMFLFVFIVSSYIIFYMGA